MTLFALGSVRNAQCPDEGAAVQLENFLTKLHNAKNKVLLLDYDGTLSRLRIERDKAVPYRGVRQALRSIQTQGDTRVVMISGRSVADLLPLLQLEPAPEIWGTHGRERRYPNGEYIIDERDISPEAIRALDGVMDRLVELGYKYRCERKPTSIAFHWRDQNPEEVAVLKAKIQFYWEAIAQEYKLKIKLFDGGMELLVPGSTKATAVEAILAETASDAAVAYLGDDLTDEDAFRRLDGRGLRILVRPQWRPTAADVWIKPPKALLAFLHAWCG